jgi:hypothetical protein
MLPGIRGNGPTQTLPYCRKRSLHQEGCGCTTCLNGTLSTATLSPNLYLSPPNSGLPFDPLLEAAIGMGWSPELHLPLLPPSRTPSMRLSPPKAFHPVMPNELGKWSSFFSVLAAWQLFEDICCAT